MLTFQRFTSDKSGLRLKKKELIHETHETDQKYPKRQGTILYLSCFVRFVDQNVFVNLNVIRT